MDKPESISEERQWQLDARAFLWAVLRHWENVGTAVFGCGAIALWIGRGFVIVPSIFAGLAIICFFVACFRSWRDERRAKEIAENELIKIHEAKPVLFPEHDSNIEGCVKVELDGRETVFAFRIKVTNKGTADAKNCHGVMRAITKNGVSQWGGNSAQLTFCQSAKDDSLKKTIISKRWEFLDVLFYRITEGEPGKIDKMGVKELTDWPFPPAASIFRTEGTYVFQLDIMADLIPPIPIEATFNFSRTGGVSTMSIRAASQPEVK